jgi:hypothetical protein
MDQDYPDPPPELVQQWWEEADQHVDCDDPETWFDYVAIQAARWDADQELYSIVCAANHALKNMEGLLETSIDETRGYTFCDLSGDVYCIRKALQFLEASIKAQGLKGDPIV